MQNNSYKLLIITSILALFSTNAFCQSIDSLKKHKTSKQSTQNRENEITDYYLQGIWAINMENNPEKGAYLFSKIIKLDSLHSASHFQLANILSFKEAIKHSEIANRLDSSNRWYQNQLSGLYVQNKDLHSAINIGKKIIKNNPNDVYAYRNLASTLYMLSDNKAAIQVIDTISNKFGLDEQSVMLKLRIYEKSDPSQEILEDLISISKAFPYLPFTLASLGEMYFKLGDTKSALENLKKAQEIDSTNVKTLVCLSELYLRTNKPEELLDIMEDIFKSEDIFIEAKTGFFTEVLATPFFYQKYAFKLDYLISILKESHPENKDVNELIAQHYINIGLLDKATQQYELMIEKGIGEEMPLNRILGIKSYLKDYEGVVKYANIGIKKFPKFETDYVLSKAYAYMTMGQHENGIDEVKKYIPKVHKDSTKSILHGLMGDIYYDKGEKENCFKSYEKSLKLDPNNINVLNNYAYHLSEENINLTKALKMAKKVLDSDQYNATYIDTYGWILYKMGRIEEARESLKEAVSLDIDKSPVIMMHYGDVLYALKEYSNARVYWRIAEKNGADKTEIKNRLSLPIP